MPLSKAEAILRNMVSKGHDTVYFGATSMGKVYVEI
jgi:hypothetical protein